jgi:hypothetical protein
MMASRGMGSIASSKMPGGQKKARRDDTDFTQYAEGGPVKRAASIDGDEFVMAAKRQGLDYNNRQVLNRMVDMVNGGETVDVAAKKLAGKKYVEGGPVGLYANINAKKKRIAAGSGEKMRKVGSPGAPTADAFKQSAKTAKK